MNQVKVFLISMVRNEEDIIGYWLKHNISEGFDGIIIADNLSNDGTRGIIENIKKRSTTPITIIDDPEPGYYQAEKMTKLAAMASNLGAYWIVPLDADELIYSMQPGFRVADRLRTLNYQCVSFRMWNHYCTEKDSIEESNPIIRMKWRQSTANALCKSAFVFNPHLNIDQGNHSISYKNGQPMINETVDIGIRHYPYRSREQFISKARIGGAAYAATTLPSSMGSHWRGYKAILDGQGEDALAEVFYQWFYFKDPQASGMILEQGPYLRHYMEI